jgi:hypothetical protein
MAKRNEIAKKAIRDDASGVDFNFTDEANTVLSAEIASLPEMINTPRGTVNTLHYLACHGLSQKIGDSYAGAAGVVSDAIDWAKATIETLERGDWSTERVGGGAGVDRPTRVVQAVMRLLTELGKTFDKTALMEKYKSKEARDKAMARADVKAHYDAITVEEAQERAAASKAKAGETAAADVDELAA